MAGSIQQRRRWAAWKKMQFAAQSRDAVCDPVRPGSEIAVSEDKPGPYHSMLGQRLRVGYYGRNDGLNVIWIVFPNGEYGDTIDHSHLRKYFKVIRDSCDTDFYGDNSPALVAI